MSIEKYILREDACLLDALKKINDSGIQIVFMVDSEGRLLGSLSDGDTRRAILKGISLSESILPFAQSNCTFLSDPISSAKCKQFMSMFALKAVPIINDLKQIIRIEINTQIFPADNSDINVLILAGGKGLRLRPLTNNIPKSLIEISGVPIIGSLLAKLKQEGFIKVFIAVNYQYEKIIDYVKDGSDFGLKVEYLIEDKFLGTAGSLISLSRKLPNSTVIVCNSDLLVESNLDSIVKTFKENGSMVTAAIVEHQIAIPYGVVEIKNNKIKSLEEKPKKLISIYAGISVFNTSLLQNYPLNSYVDLPELFLSLIDTGIEISSHQLEGYWVDIGTPDSLTEVQKNIYE